MYHSTLLYHLSYEEDSSILSKPVAWTKRKLIFLIQAYQLLRTIYIYKKIVVHCKKVERSGTHGYLPREVRLTGLLCFLSAPPAFISLEGISARSHVAALWPSLEIYPDSNLSLKKSCVAYLLRSTTPEWHTFSGLSAPLSSCTFLMISRATCVAWHHYSSSADWTPCASSLYLPHSCLLCW